jgi:hypothetical protein
MALARHIHRLDDEVLDMTIWYTKRLFLSSEGRPLYTRYCGCLAGHATRLKVFQEAGLASLPGGGLPVYRQGTKQATFGEDAMKEILGLTAGQAERIFMAHSYTDILSVPSDKYVARPGQRGWSKAKKLAIDRLCTVMDIPLPGKASQLATT